MAVFFPDNQHMGWLAFNANSATPTEMYWYIEKMGVQGPYGFSMYGRQSKTGAFIDGPALDFVQALTTDPDMSSGVQELDDDTDSPYRGSARIKFTMA